MNFIKTIVRYILIAVTFKGTLCFAAFNTKFDEGAQQQIFSHNPGQHLFGFVSIVRGDHSIDSGVSGGPRAPGVEHLLNTALMHTAYESVPYVWGGNKIGSSVDCESCSRCIVKYSKRGPSKRHLNCPACQRCGMDCSHFVHKVFKVAGMDYPYAPTKLFMQVSAKKPDSIPGLRYIGNDIRLAQPGDLLVQKNHIVILINKKSDRIGDVVHMSRTVRGGRIGGIALKKNANLTHFFGGVRRIFRHEKLMNDAPVFSELSTDFYKASERSKISRSNILQRR